MIKNSQRRKEKRQAAKWLLGLVGEDWGIRVLPAGADKPRPVHANTNRRFEAVIASRMTAKEVRRDEGGLDGLSAPSPWEAADEPQRTSGPWLDRLSQKLIVRHFENAPRRFRIGTETIVKPETVYFTGKRYRRRGETCLTLVMIDIDSHNRGGLREAMQFADHLRDGFFPDCYVETSTNGNGAHVFLIVDKTDWSDADYNAMLKELDVWLKGVLAATGIELDTAEVKGSCATVSWKDGMPIHKMGTLAKLPRDWERFEELRNSPIYTAHRLLAMTKEHPIKAEEHHAPKVQRMRREAHEEGGCCASSCASFLGKAGLPRSHLPDRFSEVWFRDGNIGPFRQETRSQRGRLGRVPRNQRFFGQSLAIRPKGHLGVPRAGRASLEAP